MYYLFFFNRNIKKNNIIKSFYLLKKKSNYNNLFEINSRLKFLIATKKVKARYDLIDGEPFCLSKIIIND